ncbi:MarR family transcriptional regulator [Frigoribacterium sp. VKM Ac-2530]|uniref:MarR family winged helix-turn-helix transcriptional regulator n=1 Tax=Frigoribacterium sp. VKM Ac-2530 TaxID=2783822 RepID=UPI00188DA462|nr:MarR family transcriptional regulator [Frigoribacterium sp. VKM Ac-2530]
MPPEPTRRNYDATGYWYGSSASERGVAVLNALRRYRAAESDMRRRTRDSMKMNETDLAALRFLVRAGRKHEPVSAKVLAEHLAITSASTSVLINRLVASGHVERLPHPTDKRGVLLRATEGTHAEVTDTLSGMHGRMITAAQGLSPDETAAVVSFLEAMTAAVDVDDHALAEIALAEARAEAEAEALAELEGRDAAPAGAAAAEPSRDAHAGSEPVSA